MTPPKPEELARERIDAALESAGWVVQDYLSMNPRAGLGVAVREFRLYGGHGKADYLLYVDGRAAGVLEAKREGTTLTGVEVQAEKYSVGLPADLPAHQRPLPFLYQSTGIETRFTNLLDPDPRSREVFHFHRPETLAAWLEADPIGLPLLDGEPDPLSQRPATLRTRMLAMPSLDAANLWPAQAEAVRNLEKSFALNRPRALVQMATGSGKTFTAITSIYRLIKHADARRVLFLVDRGNLGKQAEKEFQQYVPADDSRRFTELYNVQRLVSNRVDPVARVCIGTIQRLYSMLKGEEDLAPELDDASASDTMGSLRRDPVDVAYNPALPIEAFDVVFIDECHRSIYSVWRQVLEYFDAFLVGLTATPAKQTYAFFRKNLVMEYDHARAVADGVNVDYDVYRIRTRVSEQGAKVEAGPHQVIGRRNRATRQVRWERLDEDLTYDGDALDRVVVVPDQIRTIVQTYRDRLFTEIFPGRSHVPKTLVFAKDDSHADDIVQIVREEFGKGNDFCEKITYTTGTARVVTREPDETGNLVEKVTYKSTGVKADDHLSAFRNSYNPRIAVTVDMIATGTDVKPLEVVMFMRSVKSKNFFEQMKGRGVRVIAPSDLRAVTPDAAAKDRFVLVDCVGVLDHDLVESPPLDKQRGVSFERLLASVAAGSRDPNILSSVASRIARLDRRLGKPERHALTELAGGVPIASIAGAIVEALDLDCQVDQARERFGIPEGAEPDAEQLAIVRDDMLERAVEPLVTVPALRLRLPELKRELEQTIDETTIDQATDARFDPEIKQRWAEKVVGSFEAFLAQHRDEIEALQVLYSLPYKRRLGHADVKALAEAIAAPPLRADSDQLWRAYESLQKDRVRGAGGERLMTDLVSLVRFALHQEGELVPYRERVEARYRAWLDEQTAAGVAFTDEQRKWLDAIRDHVAANLEIDFDDFEYAPFSAMGGVGRCLKVFGAARAEKLLEELNEVLAA